MGLSLWCPQVLFSWEDIAHSACADGNICLRLLEKNAHPSPTWIKYSSWKSLLITQYSIIHWEQKKCRNIDWKTHIKPFCDPLCTSGSHFVRPWQCSSCPSWHKGAPSSPFLVFWPIFCLLHAGRHLLPMDGRMDGPAALSELPLLAVEIQTILSWASS